ncbi:gliding motility-associated C-terminal domain-containing protein [Mucilaginibacter pedocola]|uniref:Ig-like domain-containing protein n=1 Tax=Mucilaginibacter pedocola TaxID=1792845 RepID=A0A1S9PCJ4_9SPHI|nr:gliding motility-associated C-terminal domain-containing protein [Mucilaginibacter pedocola]OOQ58537.1 hypothetical protein BC343_07670 [Mucilaginibacter pedocola]
MRPIFLLLIVLLFGLPCYAQKCTGSLGAPAINETFGRGTTSAPGPALATGLTNLRYYNDNCGGDNGGEGVYTLQTFMGSCKGGTWQTIAADHTGDGNGYFMVINAGSQPDVFYTQRVSGNALCPNSVYYLGAWIMNILRDIPQTQGFSQPDITFRVETLDGQLLGEANTGVIPPERGSGKWVQYGSLFTTPADGSDFIVKLINNAPGGAGNDFAMDDITFSPCGQLIPVGFGTLGDMTARSGCRGQTLQYTFVADPQEYNNPSLQWQQNLNDGNGWQDIPGKTGASATVTINASGAGKYLYRIGVLGAEKVGSEACRIYSDPLEVDVYAEPTIVLASATGACVGGTLQLNSSGGDTYEWTGPNGFTANTRNPVVTTDATTANNGVYHVKVTSNGCDSHAETTVTVYERATVQPMVPKETCAGTPVQLTPQTTNATTYKWTPSTGLDHDDIANPMANPAVPTTYHLEVSNAGGCSASDSVYVRVWRLPVADAGPDIKLMEGDTAKLQGTATFDNLAQLYWTPSTFLDNPLSVNPITSATDNITYTLHVISTTCGESTSDVFVRVYKKIAPANTFTPNNDGVNDLWNINNIATYPHAQVSIFTKNGQPVYQSNGYAKPWDGTRGGKQLPAGVYYYIINLREDNLPPVSGWITLLR